MDKNTLETCNDLKNVPRTPVHPNQRFAVGMPSLNIVVRIQMMRKVRISHWKPTENLCENVSEVLKIVIRNRKVKFREIAEMKNISSEAYLQSFKKN